jgi:hypothetical protein
MQFVMLAIEIIFVTAPPSPMDLLEINLQLIIAGDVSMFRMPLHAQNCYHLQVGVSSFNGKSIEHCIV